jgi:formate dehydrogenase subunit delta
VAPDHLVKMANDIGAFFAADPDPARAAAGIVDHLKRFWEPRMRKALLAWLDDHGGDGLRPAVRDALIAHRALLG